MAATTTVAGSTSCGTGIFTCIKYNNKETQSIKSFVGHFLQNGAIGCAPFPSTPMAVADPPRPSSDQPQGEIRERSTLPLKTLKKQIKDGQIDVNEIEAETGVSLLMILCCKARQDAVKLLLKKGADPTMCDKNGWSSLFYAAWGQSIGCIKAILSAGSSSLINTKNIWGVTPLMISVYKCELNITQLLIKKGGDPFITDNHQRTLLHWAVMGRQVSTLQYALDKYFPKCDPCSQDSITRYSVDADGASPLHYATIMSPCEDILTLLLSEGFSPSISDHSTVIDTLSSYPALTDGLTPMHWACVISSHESSSINKLLEHDCNLVNVLSRQQLTPLHLATCVGSATLCKTLITNGAKVSVMDASGMTPLHYACHYGHIDCVSLLLDEQADVNTLSHHHMCGLHLASQEGHSDLVDYLVRVGGASRDLVSGSGNSAIHLAAINGRKESIKSLLRQGCNVDLLRESDGRSSLHLSAYNGHLDCCHVLINEGALVNRRDKTVEGCGPLDLAMIGNHTSCCDFLLSCGARTHGGSVHRAACTVQLSWRFYVHKRRKRITRDWGARVIQSSIREWQRREMARRVGKRRERKRHQSAIVIQRWWKEYLMKKKSLLESYNALKAKLKSERFATSLILKELSFNESNFYLPPCSSNNSSAALLHKNPQSNVRLPHSYTSSLLRSSIEPIPLFPNEPLVYVQQPATTTMRSQNKKTVRINTVPITMKPTNQNGEEQRVDNQTAPVALTRGQTNYTTQTESKSRTSELKRLSSGNDEYMGAISMEGDKGVARHTRNDSFRLPSINLHVGGNGVSTVPSQLQRSRPVSIPDVPPCDTNDNHTSNTTDISLPPIVSKPLVGNRLSSINDVANKKKKVSSQEKYSKKGRTDTESKPSMVRPVNETKLLLNTQRYQKLQHVAVLLEQAKDIQSDAYGEDASYDDLKNQIKAALEEAIKLRTDTDAIWDENNS